MLKSKAFQMVEYKRPCDMFEEKKQHGVEQQAAVVSLLWGLRQTISFIEISIEAGILLGGRHEACFVLGMAGIEPMPS